MKMSVQKVSFNSSKFTLYNMYYIYFTGAFKSLAQIFTKSILRTLGEGK